MQLHLTINELAALTEAAATLDISVGEYVKHAALLHTKRSTQWGRLVLAADRLVGLIHGAPLNDNGNIILNTNDAGPWIQQLSSALRIIGRDNL